jgi:hypothetical protein
VQFTDIEEIKDADRQFYSDRDWELIQKRRADHLEAQRKALSDHIKNLKINRRKK